MLYFNENYKSVISFKTQIVEFLNKEWKVIRFLPGISLLQVGAATFTAYTISTALLQLREPLTSKKKLIKAFFPITLFGAATYLIPKKVSLIAAISSYFLSKIILNSEQLPYKGETPLQPKSVVLYPKLEKRGIVFDQNDNELSKKLILILEKMDRGLDHDKKYSFSTKEEFLAAIITHENIPLLELLVDNPNIYSILFKNVTEKQSVFNLETIWNCSKEEVLFKAIEKGLDKIVTWCIQKKYPVTYGDLVTGTIFLHHAASNGNLELLNLLVTTDIDTSASTREKLIITCCSRKLVIPKGATYEETYEFVQNIYNFLSFYFDNIAISNKSIGEFYLSILEKDDEITFSSLFIKLSEMFSDEEQRNKAIKVLFEGSLYIDCSDNGETSLLIYALNYNCPKIQKWLLQQLNLKFFLTSIEKESERDYFYRKLIQNDYPLTVEAFIHLLKQDKRNNEVFEEAEKKIFSHAVEEDACEIVKFFCKQGYAVNIVFDCKNEELLYYTIEDGLFKISAWLMENGYSLNYRDKVNGASLLHYAAGKKAASMIALLLDKGADPTICTTGDFRFFWFNFFNGVTLSEGITYKFIESIIEYIDSISPFYEECNEALLLEGNSSSIPLFFYQFIKEDNLEGFSHFYSKLREKFSDISQRNIALKALFDYETEMDLLEDVVDANSSKIICWLLQNKREDFKPISELCLKAAQLGNEKTTLFFYEQLQEKEIYDEYGRTPLHLLALHQKNDVCNKLIRLGANKNAKTQIPSPFIREGIELLIPAHSTYRIILMMHGMFPEFESAPKSSLELLEEMVKSSPGFFDILKERIIEIFPGSTFNSLFLQALWHKKKNILTILLKKSPPSHISHDALRECAFTYAKKANRSMIKLLFDYGFNPATVDENGMSLLHTAAFSGDKEFIAYLLEKGVPAHCKTTQNVIFCVGEERIQIKPGATYDIFLTVCFTEMARLLLIKKISKKPIDSSINQFNFKIFEKKKIEELLEIFFQGELRVSPGQRTLLDITCDQLEILLNDWQNENNRFFYEGSKEISCIKHLRTFKLLLKYGVDPLIVSNSYKTPYRRFCDLLQKVESNPHSFVLVELMEQIRKLMVDTSCNKYRSMQETLHSIEELPREIVKVIAGYMWGIEDAFPNYSQKKSLD